MAPMFSGIWPVRLGQHLPQDNTGSRPQRQTKNTQTPENDAKFPIFPPMGRVLAAIFGEIAPGAAWPAPGAQSPRNPVACRGLCLWYMDAATPFVFRGRFL
ncbi:MAG: hypothetical protein EBU97_02725 [Rhodobacteraceae bacterium]|nr:hypothetical protein [Paracoccaceae bacterium]